MRRGNKYIGVFDSGFGGLDVLRGIVKELPSYNYIYLGDTARLPYGNRPKETVYEFTKQAVDFLFRQNCELIILACNTASSDALRKIQREYLPKKYPHKKVLGVLIPLSEEAVKYTKSLKVGVIATVGTVQSKSFLRELKKLNPRIEVFQEACPLLVPLVEAGKQNSKKTDLALKKYLKPLLKENIDTLILGCTHYGILEKQIQKMIGPKIKIISGSELVGKKLKDYLSNHKELEKKLGKGKARVFYSTKLTANFTKLGSKFFGSNIIARKAVIK